MDMKMIRTMVEESVDTPLIFLLYTAIAFAVVVLIGSAIYYVIACSANKMTQMTGIMRVTVALNQFPSDMQDTESPMLSYGSYFIGMQDPAEVSRQRLDPKLNWIESAQYRRYQIGTILERFRNAFDSAGFAGDPASKLLEQLLEDDVFCEKLGSISRKNAKRGLRVQAASEVTTESSVRDRVSVYHTIPQIAGNAFENELRCDVRMICITLEYFDR